MEKFYSHPTSIIDHNCSIGTGTKIWHFSHIMSNVKIGEYCIFGQNTFIAPNVNIGNNVKVQNNVSIYTGVTIEDDVFLGPSMVFTNVINPRSFIERKDEFKETVIKRGASIGANATIVCGNTIGQYAMIGAGAVITKNIKDFEMVVGNPAQHKAWVSKSGHKLSFENGIAKCPETQEVYILKKDTVYIQE